MYIFQFTGLINLKKDREVNVDYENMMISYLIWVKYPLQ